LRNPKHVFFRAFLYHFFFHPSSTLIAKYPKYCKKQV
ncbi:hypothetical protein N338_12479, partial [Podiceps cristatus]